MQRGEARQQEPVPFSLDIPNAGFDEGVMDREINDEVTEGNGK